MGSLLGKVCDIIPLKKQGSSLSTDVLQFESKPHSSTTIRLSLHGDTV